MPRTRKMLEQDSVTIHFEPAILLKDAPGHYGERQKPSLYWRDDEDGLYLFKGDCLILMEEIAAKYPKGIFDLIFADPPYFLSNGGITCQAGKMVSVNKGAWDRLPSLKAMHRFNTEWLSLCKRVLTDNGTIFVSGTSHVIHSIGFAMQQLEFKILNDITWVKPNPPPNLSCRYFTHASETILWAAKSKRSKHKFNYAEMRQQAGGKQMRNVWPDIRWDDRDGQVFLEIPPPATEEKAFGKHPTQKPLMLLERLLTAASDPGAFVLDPFVGSGTTVVAAQRLGRRCVGCDLEAQFLDVAKKRLCTAKTLEKRRLFS